MAGSSKGSSFERWVAKTLSLWWTEGRSDDCFWRTSNSGGRATVRGKRGKQTRSHYGDLCATDEEGAPFLRAFTVEIKRGYSRHTPFDLVDKPDRARPQVWGEWIVKARQTARAAGSVSWMVIAKRDQRVPFVVADARVTFLEGAATMLLSSSGLGHVRGLPLPDMLARVRPRDVVAFLRECSDGGCLRRPGE